MKASHLNDKAKATIRKATANDLAGIVELCAAHAAFEDMAFDFSGLQQRLAEAIAGPDPRLVIFTAVGGGTSVGYASATREFSTWKGVEFLHMDCLFVLENMRGQAIGRRLFDAVTEEARSTGISNVEWQTPAWNTDAIDFYHSLGATDKAKARFNLCVSKLS